MESRNFILKGAASDYYWKGPGLCSIKTFSGGSAFYNIGNGSFRVDDDSFLVLNDGTDYSIEISGKQIVHSYCLFFDRDLVAEAALGLASSPEFQLDNIGYYGNENPARMPGHAIASLPPDPPPGPNCIVVYCWHGSLFMPTPIGS